MRVNHLMSQATGQLTFDNMYYKNMTLVIFYHASDHFLKEKYFVVSINNNKIGQIKLFCDKNLARALWHAREFILEYNKKVIINQ
jgi:hypothetical protein